jgi:hypothetical protein
MDPTQYKAREVDLIAEKVSWDITGAFGKVEDKVGVRLFIECKFVPRLTVFWFAEKQIQKAFDLIAKQGPFRAGNSFGRRHHYAKESADVAKLFQSTSGNNNKLAAEQQDPFYKALNQVLNAAMAMRGQSFSPAAQAWKPRQMLEYPVIVCGGFDQLYGVNFFGPPDEKPVALSENFQMEVQYAYFDRNRATINEYRLIDVVDIDQLNSFQNSIDQDAQAAALLLSK